IPGNQPFKSVFLRGPLCLRALGYPRQRVIASDVVGQRGFRDCGGEWMVVEGEEGRAMRVLVIGGSGNISREIVRALLRHGHEVTVFNRGRHRDPQPEGVRVALGDRKEREAFEATTRALEPDAVIDMISFSPD